MPSELSIHDNRILAHTVDCNARIIVLHTICIDYEPNVYTDVIFSDVAAYHFEGDNLNTVLFDIQEITPNKIYATYKSVFERSKDYDWPRHYNNESELLQAFQQKNLRGFLITPSMGLGGFVISQKMKIVPALPLQCKQGI